jgi:hypothetical protein
LTDDKVTAAQWADAIAERMAEAERDYQRAASAGFEFGELAEDIARRRREILDLLRERKAVAGPACGAAPTICAALRGRVAANVKAIRKARKRRAELADCFAGVPGFADAA